jgi:CelD/BcsL family acetyltransferase involved in cellulose biosynthesis
MWDRLEPFWGDLVDRTGESSAFLSVRWLRAWMRAFGPEAEPSGLLWRSEAGATVGCALLSTGSARRGPFRITRSFLNASGVGLMPEHNDLIVVAERRSEVVDDFVRVVRAHGADELALVGAREAAVHEIVSRWPSASYEGFFGEAPYVDLDGLRDRGGEYVAVLSSNTRSQIRRSLRRYEQRFGTPTFEVATSLEQRIQWLGELVLLHDARWARAGQPGAFAGDDVQRFHRILLEECSTSHGPTELRVDLARVRFGDTPIGFLYNLMYKGRVSFFQSGLRYDEDRHLKPGLVSHAFAVEHYLAAGASEYDFLGGEPATVRYKRSLSTSARSLGWVQLPAPTAKMRIIRTLRHLRRRVRASA